jgi:predicted O-linked N-acetylglucosamine transferase (SPINDLY family)
MSNADKVEKLRIRAAQLHGARQLDEAEKLYRRVLELRRGDIPARYMIGVVRLQQGRAADALAIIEPLLAEAPDDADIRTQCGLARQDLGRHAEALADFDRALALNPDNPLTLLYRGNFFVESGAFAQALDSYERLLRIAPGYDEAWFRRGSALWLMERHDEALASYERALDLNPGHFGAAFNSATILLKLERYDEAFAAFETARARRPDHPYILGGLASAVQGGCDLARWQDFQALVVRAVIDKSAVIAPLVLHPFSNDGVLRRRCSENFAADRVPGPKAPLWDGKPYQHGRIRIAYLSADFRQHATADLIAGLIEGHDRARFEIAGISFGPDDRSAMRARLTRAFDRFEDVGAKSEFEIARLLKDGEFDIAVDLKGHTEGARPGILAHRPCPVQVNYLGYPGTIGAPWLDYILADPTVLPFAHQPFYSEKIVHLPHCYQCNDSSRPIAEVPARRDAGLPELPGGSVGNGFVFCNFNAGWKITPAMFDVWMRLLAAVPGSLLWLLNDNSTATGNLRAAAAARDTDPARLVFAPRLPSAAHLARHRLADLFLDTMPYNAHTTASDALWAGLPMITCLGEQFDGRVAASLLATMGLPELVTHSMEDYESLALALARDPARLGGIRAKLAEMRLTSPLYDTGLFRKSIETAFLRMMEMSNQGLAPQSFTVSA